MEKENPRNRITQNCRQILDAAVDGIIISDRDGAILGFNNAAERMFGYHADEVLGESINILMPPPYKNNHDGHMHTYQATGQKRIIGTGREVLGRRKDGTVFPMELAVSELDIEGELLFTGIARDISERRQLENEILQISEKERQNIGRELHDGLGQMLTGIGLIAQNLARRLQQKGADEASEVAELANMLKAADRQARALSHGLVPTELEDQQSQAALKQLCEQSDKLFEMSCCCEIDPAIEINDQMMTLHLYRILQEAIRNAHQHGRATVVKVSLQQNGDFLKLTVRDNGDGFTDSIECEKQKGIGLNTMSYRAHLLGGYIHFKTTETGSVLIDCRIPVQEFITITGTSHE